MRNINNNCNKVHKNKRQWSSNEYFQSNDLSKRWIVKLTTFLMRCSWLTTNQLLGPLNLLMPHLFLIIEPLFTLVCIFKDEWNVIILNSSPSERLNTNYITSSPCLSSFKVNSIIAAEDSIMIMTISCGFSQVQATISSSKIGQRWFWLQNHISHFSSLISSMFLI